MKVADLNRELAETERQASLASRLPAVIKGTEKPKSSAERLAFALLCYQSKYFAASTRLYVEALADDPKLAEDMRFGNRYNAACAAALAGVGQGKDDPKPTEEEKTRLRKQASAWLRADLAFWTKLVANEIEAQNKFIAQTLQHWKVDADLAGVREEDALKKLSAEERQAWRSLWEEVNALLAKAQKKL